MANIQKYKISPNKTYISGQQALKHQTDGTIKIVSPELIKKINADRRTQQKIDTIKKEAAELIAEIIADEIMQQTDNNVNKDSEDYKKLVAICRKIIDEAIIINLDASTKEEIARIKRLVISIARAIAEGSIQNPPITPNEIPYTLVQKKRNKIP